MIHRKLHLACAFVALSLLHVAASAQVAPLRGRVLFGQADASTVPVDGARVDVFRTDMVARYDTKTANDGLFVFAGLPVVGVYIIAVSSPNAKPLVIANVKAGREVEVELILEPGDGTRLTKEEAEASLKVPTNGEPLAQLLNRKFSEANDALRNQDYDKAIKLYDECLANVAQPSSMAPFLVNKTVAFMNRGIEKYNSASSTHDEPTKSAQVDSAVRDFREAAEAINSAVEIIRVQPISTDENGRAFQGVTKMLALRLRAEAMSLLVTKVDPTQAAAGLAAFQEYINQEDNPFQKAKAELDAARMLLDANNTKSAIEQYRRLLVSDPQNLEAIFGYGFALYQSGEQARFQEAAHYLKYFLEQSPETDPLRAVAAETLKKLLTTRSTQIRNREP